MLREFSDIIGIFALRTIEPGDEVLVDYEPVEVEEEGGVKMVAKVINKVTKQTIKYKTGDLVAVRPLAGASEKFCKYFGIN